MSAYYNEIDPYAAQWLRNLIAAGHIAPGNVDTRSIENVRPEELAPYTQCHFFAGIGVWSHALRRAGWPDDRPVWTGSCPCQPFSAAGKRNGFTDERHLWPVWFRLIEACSPSVVFGEQVASKDGLAWLDAVHTDLESAGYAFGAADLCAAGVGAPHIRQRLYWVGDADHQGLERYAGHGDDRRRWPLEVGSAAPASESDGLADDDDQGQLLETARLYGRRAGAGGAPAAQRDAEGAPRHDADGRCPTDGYWRDADWLGCRDGKWRPVEPGTFPLAHGTPARVGRLRAYGNAIVAPLAAEFVTAYLEARQ